MLHGPVYFLLGGRRLPQNMALLRSSGIPPGASFGAAAARGCPTPLGQRPSRGPPPEDTGTVTTPALRVHIDTSRANRANACFQRGEPPLALKSSGETRQRSHQLKRV